MISAGGLKRKSKAASEIPSSSLADMAFLLLIFFMVTTTFRKEQSRNWEPPEAQATKKLDAKRRDILHVYVEQNGNIYINDLLVPPEQVSAVVAPIYEESDRRLVVSLRADRDVPYVHIDGVQKELQEAGAVRVAFYTNLEQRVARAVR
ncbi:MAG TPA: biopolymer transporter ExbD [Longimicrobiales bacterium]|nr:biopolymer transporter ExbD [Longimicrobiales bacterium]